MHLDNDLQVRLGDCLSVLKEISSGAVDLIYLDPPFFTNKVHRLSSRDRSKEFSFDDLWSSQSEYAKFLFDRLKEMHRVLSTTGSLFFHCDRNAVHVVRMLLDNVFGSGNFRSEIIWHYRRWSNSQRGLLPCHQTILYYSKSAKYVFNEVLMDYSFATNVDQILQRRSRDESNKSVYARDSEGNVISNGVKRGVPLGDVWDIPFLNPKAKERVGYPTQKPLLLLERIIGISTNEGGRVLDPFCGSGTSLIAAMSLRRSAIGIDISQEAIDLTKVRINKSHRSRSRLVESGRDSYRNADDVALSMLKGLDYIPVHRNAGIDAILKEEFDGGPVTIRVQRRGETVLDAAQKVHAASVDKGAKLMFIVVLTKGDCFAFADELPLGVIAIESPAISIQTVLEKSKDELPRRAV